MRGLFNDRGEIDRDELVSRLESVAEASSHASACPYWSPGGECVCWRTYLLRLIEEIRGET